MKIHRIATTEGTSVPVAVRKGDRVEHVYMIGGPQAPLVKIGRSINVDQRLTAIQAMSPVPLTVLWRHPGGCRLEAKLHRYFARFRAHGEWFDFGGEDPVPLVEEVMAAPERAVAPPRPSPVVTTARPQTNDGVDEKVPEFRLTEFEGRLARARNDTALTRKERELFLGVAGTHGFAESFTVEPVARRFGLSVPNAAGICERLATIGYFDRYVLADEAHLPTEQRTQVYGLCE